MPSYCPICGNEVPGISHEPPNNPRFECRICGKYRLTEYAAQKLYEFAYYNQPVRPHLAENHHLLSAVIRERYEREGRREVFIPDFDEVRAAATPKDDPFVAVDCILLYVARTSTRAGDKTALELTSDYPIAYARDAQEFEYFIQLATQIGFLEVESGPLVRLSPDGWKRLKQLRLQEIDPDSAFVAMSFNADMENTYEQGFEPALRDTGFRAIRVDLIEHNGKIDDRIVADIRKSALVVADFTGHRQNVYFEAGFAMGLGRYVIWTCRESDISQAHFDTRQYNHIVWRDAADLRLRLQNRIEATIPRS